MRFVGLDPTPVLALFDAQQLGVVEIAQRATSVISSRGLIEDERAHVSVETVTIDIDRSEPSVRFASPDPLDLDSLAHPYLAWPAAVLAQWRGQEALHSGAVTVAGTAAWGIVGGHEGGKSTLLAALANAGGEVLADDLLVVNGTNALAGPRCLDLRPEAASVLGVRGLTDPVRQDGRYRMRFPPAPSSVPLAGFVHLAWGARTRVERLPAADRLRRLTQMRTLPNRRPDPLALLTIAALPAFEFCRPRAWVELLPSAEALLTHLSEQSM